MRTQNTLLLAVGLALAACSSNGTLDGTIAGDEVAVADAIFWRSIGTGGQEVVTVALTDQADACNLLQSGHAQADSAVLLLSLTHFSGKAQPGHYTIAPRDPSDSLLRASFDRTDAACQPSLPPDKVAVVEGFADLEAVDLVAGGEVRGTFGLTLGTQKDTVTGDFSATFCKVPATAPANGLSHPDVCDPVEE